MTAWQEKQLKKETYSLYYYTAGDSNREAIVFIHPAYGDHTCFHNQVDAFAKDYYLIFVDMPGHGQSQVRGGNVTIEKTIDLVGEIIAAEGYAQVHLVGGLARRADGAGGCRSISQPGQKRNLDRRLQHFWR